MGRVIEDKILKDNQTPVFLLKGIRKIYQGRLKNLGAFDGAFDEFIKNVNVTRHFVYAKKEIENMSSSQWKKM